MESLLSFPVGLFHPLQHAGLSRRSPVGRQTATRRLRAESIYGSHFAIDRLNQGLDVPVAERERLKTARIVWVTRHVVGTDRA